MLPRCSHGGTPNGPQELERHRLDLQGQDSGRWVGAVTLGYTDDGRPRRRTVTGTTQEAVEDRLDNLRKSLEIGPDLPAEMTTARFLSYWLAEVLPHADIAQSTAEGYERIVRLYVTPAVGKVRLDQLAPPDVRKMLTGLREQGLSPNTQRLARSILRRALRTAEAEGYT